MNSLDASSRSRRSSPDRTRQLLATDIRWETLWHCCFCFQHVLGRGAPPLACLSVIPGQEQDQMGDLQFFESDLVVDGPVQRGCKRYRVAGNLYMGLACRISLFADDMIHKLIGLWVWMSCVLGAGLTRVSPCFADPGCPPSSVLLGLYRENHWRGIDGILIQEACSELVLIIKFDYCKVELGSKSEDWNCYNGYFHYLL